MVAFGKKLKQLQLQEWHGYYINYKLMKKKVKQYVQQIEVSEQNRDYVLMDFSRVLDKQIEKTVLFLLEQQGQLASWLSNLGEQHEALIQQNDAARISELQEAYRNVGRDLLKLLHFIELNAIGLRKILKKFDKRFGCKFTNYYVKTRANHPYSQLKQVFKHVGISAVVGTLSRTLQISRTNRRALSQSMISLPYLSRFFLTSINISQLLKLLCSTSHVFHVMPTFRLLKICQFKVLERNLLTFDARMSHTSNIQINCNHRRALKTSEKDKCVKSVFSTRQLVCFWEQVFVIVLVIRYSLTSEKDSTLVFIFKAELLLSSEKYLLPWLDPIIESIKAAVDTLTNSTDFLQYIGKHALILEDELSTPSDDDVDERYHFMSLLLNHASFSSVYFSAWSNKSYMKPLVFSSIVLFIGNTLYALAYDLNSVYILLIGRLFCGLGSARAVNRRYISDCVPLKKRMKASVGFVSAGALGMACGPAFSSLLETNFTILKITFNEDTLPGWVMALAWLVYLLWLLVSFREPSHYEKVSSMQQESSNGMRIGEAGTFRSMILSSIFIWTGNWCFKTGVSQPLLLSSVEKQQDEDDDQEFDISEEGSEENHKPVTSIVSAYKLLTPSVKVQLFIYFMLKYAMEVLLAESSVITAYYFIWSSRNVAIFLACLGLTVLPVNVIVGSYLSNMFEERQVLLASEVMLCVGIVLSFQLIIPYSVPQYVCSALLTFVAAEVLEGVNLSLLSRVMSPRLSRGTYNGGLLSTEAGTLARVVADGTITLAGYWGMSNLLNATLLPSFEQGCCAIVSGERRNEQFVAQQRPVVPVVKPQK
ncbi:hypothetical protein DH2020_002270 [Rehmannia glutinosa]|uniref:SPX domain-containing protein n=1 Tax=Rehmannia glutinosa TaxID=99300 RepID=A0ABR0XTH4_REHGL